MSTGALDPLIHNPERPRVVAILAALPGGDALSVARLQGIIGLTPGTLMTRLHEPGDAGRDAVAAALCEHFAPAGSPSTNSPPGSMPP